MSGSLLVLVAAAVVAPRLFGDDPGSLPTFEQQACSLPAEVLDRVQHGLHPQRSGDITLLPARNHLIEYAHRWGAGTAWDRTQRIPLVFYGPGLVSPTGEVEGEATLADVAPTLATSLRGNVPAQDGASLDEVVTLERMLERPPLRLIVTLVWHGAGWNVLEDWPGDWTDLLRAIEGGVMLADATVGTSPPTRAAAIATMATGSFPWRHGVTGPEHDPLERSLAARWSDQSEDALVGAVSDVPETDVWLGDAGRRVDSGGEAVGTASDLIVDEGFGADDVTDLLFVTEEGIERALAASGPGSEAVFEAIQEQDRALGSLIETLEARVGRGRYLLVIAADGGSDPDAVTQAVSIGVPEDDLLEVIGAEFERSATFAGPTQMSLDGPPTAPDETDELARFLGDLRVADLAPEQASRRGVDGAERFFALAAPVEAIHELDCSALGTRGLAPLG